MKDFTYHNANEYCLLSDSCSWLRQMGLLETFWVLDIKWIIFYYEDIVTYKEWIREK